VAELILLAAGACFVLAGLLSFLRHAYHPVPIPLHREVQRYAFIGSITAMLAMGVAMLLWWAVLNYP
jgi:hypothetical protein